MSKFNISPNLFSYHAVRRGEWVLKVSVFKNKHIMVVAYNPYDMELQIKHFNHPDEAANFIEKLIEE
jgi:hypothetical protein